MYVYVRESNKARMSNMQETVPLQNRSVEIEPPKIRVNWLRGSPSTRIDFKRPKAHLGLGGRGTGKSALLEAIAVKYPKIIDFYGSRDNEGLAWLRCPLYSKNEILLLTGDGTELNGPWDTCKMFDFGLHVIEQYRVIVSVSAFYRNMDAEFKALNKLIYNKLYTRTYWHEAWFLLIREASNFLYARIKITKNQTIAKNDFIYLLRETRHMGYPCGVDTIRWTSLDKEVRDVSDYLFIKGVGIMGLPRDLRFVYKYVDPYSLMDAHPSTFVVIAKKGPLGVGNFELPVWHKKEDENMLEAFGLKPEYNIEPVTGDETERNIVGDQEHNEIVVARVKGKSMGKIARALGRSSGTINKHLKDHNLAVGALGVCPRCERIHAREAYHTTKQLKEFWDKAKREGGEGCPV